MDKKEGPAEGRGARAFQHLHESATQV